jgi:DNA-binding NarL/FixJ family response regulator
MSAGKLSTQARTRKTVLIVDDHPMMRNGLAQAINSERDLKVSAQAENSHQAMNAIRTKKFDLAIVDISLHGKGGLELIKDMRVEAPQTLILVVSIHDELLYAERALRAGANGYIMKDAGGETLLKAIRHILGGQVYVSHEIASKILNDSPGGAASVPIPHLCNSAIGNLKSLNYSARERGAMKLANSSPSAQKRLMPIGAASNKSSN